MTEGLSFSPGDRWMFSAGCVLVQVTFIVLTAWTVAGMIGRHNAAVRHCLWLSALLCVLASPAITYLAARAGVSIVSLARAPAVLAVGSHLTEPNTAVPRPGAEGPSRLGLEKAAGDDAPAPPAASAGPPDHMPRAMERPDERSSAVLTSGWRTVAAAAVTAWSLGAAWCFLRLVSGWRYLRRLRWEMKPLAGSPLAAILPRVRTALNREVLPRVMASAHLDSPVTFGFRPVVVLPAHLLGMLDERELYEVLLHECAHAARRDHYVGILQRTAEIVFWPHPLIYVLNRELARAREEVCDNYVLQAGDRLGYARTLLKVAETLIPSTSRPQAFGLFLPRWRLEQRVAGILDARRTTVTRTGFWSAGLTAIFFLALTLVPAGVSIHAEPAEAPRANVVPRAPDSTAGGAPATPAIGAKAASADDDAPPILLSAFGRVLDAAGNAAVGVSVHLREWSTLRISQNPYDPDPQDILASMETDQQGSFRFENVPAKPFHDRWRRQVPWDVVVVAKGHAIAWRHMSVRCRETPLEIRLRPEATLTGRVSDGRGRPIAGLDVRVRHIASQGSGGRPDFSDPATLDLQASELAPSAKTDSEGRVTLTGLPRDVRLVIGLHHDQHRSKSLLVATTHRPQPDLEVAEEVDGEWSASLRPVRSGRFIAVMDPPSPKLIGQITAADTGAPLEQVKVVASGGNEIHFVLTDDKGRFAIPETGRTRYRLLVVPPEQGDYLGCVRMVDIPAGQVAVEANAALERGEIVLGMVVEEGTNRGVGGVTVVCDNGLDVNQAETDGSLSRPVTTDDEGRFRLPVPLGKSRLYVAGPVRGFDLPESVAKTSDFAPRFFREVDVRPGQAVGEVTFGIRRLGTGERPGWSAQASADVPRARSVEGKVVDPEGQAVADAQVALSSWSDSPESEGRVVRSDAAGYFVLRVVELRNDDRLEIIHQERKLRGTAPVPPAQADSAVQPVEVRLSPTGAVTGRVLEGEMRESAVWRRSPAFSAASGPPIKLLGIRPIEGGNPVVGVQVSLLVRRWGRLDRQVVRTDEQGRFEFGMVEAGSSFQVGIRAEGYSPLERPQKVTVEAGKTIELEPLLLLRADKFVAGIVVDSEGNPVAGARVSAEEQLRRIPIAATDQLTGPDGRFTIRHVPDTPLRLRAFLLSADDAVRTDSVVDAEPGDTHVQIILGPKLLRGDP